MTRLNILRDRLRSLTPQKGAIEKRNNLLFWLAVFLAIFFLYIAFKGINWNDFISILKNANFKFLPVIFFWGSLAYFIRSIRWRVLLQAEKPLKPLRVFWANMVGYFGNTFFPARAGELFRAVYLGKDAEISASFVFASGLVERIVDVIALVTIGSISLLSIGNFSPLISSAIRLMAIFGLIGLFVIILLPFVKQYLFRIIDILPVFKTKRSVLYTFINNFINGVRSLHNIQRILLFVGLTAIIWIMDGLGLILLATMLRLNLLLPQALVLLASLGLSSAIPSTPGYIGVYQFVAVTILMPFGYARSSAIALITISQVLNMLLVSGLGGIGVLRMPSRLKNKSGDSADTQS